MHTLTPYRIKKHGGFTLLELSIVLVIIGLLFGGIIAGQSLIRSSQLRAVLSEYDSYLKGIKEFQDKYHALPGDMKGAQTIWGTDGACDNAYNTTPKIPTCDGDGNGRIGDGGQYYEWYRAWQQLSNAGFVTGRFTGAYGALGSTDSTPGVNVPASKLTATGWSLTYYPRSVTLNIWPDVYGHIFWYGATVAGYLTQGNILTPSEAYDIDSKIDDGKPALGNVRTLRLVLSPNCTANETSQDTVVYNETYTQAACMLYFISGF